ncbi:unnamed protein product [Linum trigynum]|uniref:Thioester reductase (TE) domain-containing protein n=1 Tax=Linum trigynum TaxID=586398 RepID=A0AAV2GEF6_9ROSI
MTSICLWGSAGDSNGEAVEPGKSRKRKKMSLSQNGCINSIPKTSAMQNLGLERAHYYGWPNTYTFTKAMAEMVIVDWWVRELD